MMIVIYTYNFKLESKIEKRFLWNDGVLRFNHSKGMSSDVYLALLIKLAQPTFLAL